MCTSPILIRNPNKGKFVSSLVKSTQDCVSDFIKVPCGYCKECIAVKQMYFVQRAMMENLNSHMFFSTLTYDNAHLPFIDTSSDYRYRYADFHHLQLMFKRLRKHNSFGRPFRYFAVSELGSTNGRPHFHVLWWLPKYDGEDLSDGYSLNNVLYKAIRDNWCINKGSLKRPIYESLFTFQSKYYGGKLFSNYDTHLVVPSLTSSGMSSVAFYACKYLFKYSDKEQKRQQALRLNLDNDEYEETYRLVRSRSFMSTSFGLGGSHNRSLIVDYIKGCIAKSDRRLHYPQFFNPDTGQSFPLAPFYKSRESLYPYWVACEFDKDNPINDDSKEITDCLVAEQEYNRISNIIDKDLSIQFNFLFE